jgi:hypothetical protein
MNNVALQLTKIINELQIKKQQPIDWVTKPSSGKWSNKEILGHLIDSAMINLQRFIRCTYEEDFRLTYEQDNWVVVQHYQHTHINDIIDLWTLINKQIIRVLENYPSNRLSARCDNSKHEPNQQSVAWLANDYVEHLRHHLNQIK